MAAIEKAEAQPIIDNLNAQIESFQALTDDGFEVPLEDFEALAASIKELPDALTQDLKTDFELLALDSSFVNQLREATPSEISKHISSIKQGGVEADELRNLNLAEKCYLI